MVKHDPDDSCNRQTEASASAAKLCSHGNVHVFGVTYQCQGSGDVEPGWIGLGHMSGGRSRSRSGESPCVENTTPTTALEVIDQRARGRERESQPMAGESDGEREPRSIGQR